MKVFIFLLCLMPAVCMAQPGYITAIAGSGTSGFTGDGGSATAAQMGQALGVCVDGSGNIYIPDDDHSRIRKINPASGIITTIAGGGSSTADGIPATIANLNLSAAVGAITTDAFGNIFIIESNRIRKITAATGIITTIAGAISSGFSGDGGPATAALLNAPGNLCIDAGGNIYIGDHGNYRVRKVNTAGIISTYAGTSSGGFSGDGGPATAAQMQSPDGLCIDGMGNLYVADRYNYRIRKIDPSGIISTYAGSGSSGFSGDGGPATAARFFEPSNVCTDFYGNLYIADFHNSRVRKVTPTGIVSTYAGGGSSSTGSGIPATSASLSDVWGIGIDNNNNIYVPDRHHYRICKINGLGIVTAVADSFSVFVNTVCSGPEFTIAPVHYSSSLNIKTWFGDGTSQTDIFSASSGYSWFSHTYNYPGIYTVKHILYNGTTELDSVTYSYSYQFCRTMPVRLFVDANSNCAFDIGSEFLLNHPTTIEVDSNGIAVDTISLMSGVDYNANGSPGDIYRFKVLTNIPGIVPSCPSTGIITDTLIAGNNTTKYIGFQCSGTPGFDLKEHVFTQSGKHMQSGNLIVNNTYCTPQSSVLTVNFSPKYIYQSANPTPFATGSHSITWNLGSLSSVDTAPTNVHFTLTVPGAYLTPGDTVNSMDVATPISGDAYPTDNTCIHSDTVKSSYDPNEMDVSPLGYIPAGTTLSYSTEFENTGNDTAHNIYVLDTIPNSLDVHSLTMVTSSNQIILSKIFNGSSWVLKFDFQHINLLDSSHHDQCNGVFEFTINTLSSVPPGTIITNQAGIYFDDNPVVMTNSVTNIISGTLNTVIPREEVRLYPNPVNNLLHLDKVPTAANYRILNLLGATILQGELQSGSNNILLQPIMQGVYIIELTDIQGNRITRKIVKE